MVTILALLAVLGILVAAAFLSTREEPLLADAPRDAADLPLPDGPLSPDDVSRLRFSLAPRGYRMAEVDLALERLQAELADRDRRIGLLEAAASGANQPTAVREATPADLPVTPPAAPVVAAPAPAAPPVVEPAVQQPVAAPAAPANPLFTSASATGIPPLPPVTPAQPGGTAPVTVPEEPAPLPPADLGSELVSPEEHRQQ